MKNVENTTAIRRLKSMLPKFETKSNLENWWLGYCDGGNWPSAVFSKGHDIIFNHFKKTGRIMRRYQIAFYITCIFCAAGGWFAADSIGWDIVSMIESGSTSPDWALQSMNADAEHAMDNMINIIGALFGFAFSATMIGTGQLGFAINQQYEEDEGIEQHLITK